MSFLTSVYRVTDDVVQVRFAFVNFFFVGNHESWVLVDAGLPGCADTILRLADDLFGPGAQPRAILLTHGHFDHRGALSRLLERWPVPVYAHKLEIPYLTGRRNYPRADPTVGRGLIAMMSFMFPRRAIDIRPHAIALPKDGSVPGLPEWRWVHTRGHTGGHVSFFRDSDRFLIAGDAFVTTKQESLWSVLRQKKGVYGPPAYFTTRWGLARDSVRHLARLEPLVAVTGHGLPMSGMALRAGLERLVENFDKIAVPARGRYRDTRFDGLKAVGIKAEEEKWREENMAAALLSAQRREAEYTRRMD